MAGKSETMIKFLLKYKELPCLWRVHDPDYHNKGKRAAANEELLEIYQREDANANVKSVKEKLAKMRSAWQRAHKEASEQNG